MIKLSESSFQKGRYKICLIAILCLLSVVVFAQDDQSSKDNKNNIYVEHMDVLSFDEKINPDVQILKGNVIFRHDSSYMYCDSAYFYEKTNSLEAFSNVRIEQGDTLFIYGNYLFYDGNTELAQMRENVRMENNSVTLFTDNLDYDRISNLGYYFDGGMIVDEENELSSFYGKYSPATKDAVFNDSVRLENLRFILYSDTLLYNTDSKVATILGPSVIESDSATIYSTRGWYDTTNELSMLYDRSLVISGDKSLTGDSIFYDQATGFGEAFGNMSIRDTAQKVILEGQYGYYNDVTGFALATDSACFMEYSQQDTLFLHADTLKMQTIDSLYREMTAYYNVRFYRPDLQGVCDSMKFNTKDTILYMYTDPVLWNESYQLYGDTILIYLNDSTIDFAHVKQFAFAAQEMDSSYYNQLKGSDLKAFFEGSVIERIEVAGNAESIFYPLEKDGSKVGMNETKSGFLNIWIKDNKIDLLKIWPSPQGVLTPIPDLDPGKKFLKDFFWFNYLRPVDKDDIFKVIRRQTQDAPKRSDKFKRNK